MQGDRCIQGRYVQVWLYLQKNLASVIVVSCYFFFFGMNFAAGIEVGQLSLEDSSIPSFLCV